MKNFTAFSTAVLCLWLSIFSFNCDAEIRRNETVCWTKYQGVCVTKAYRCPDQLRDVKMDGLCDFPLRSRCCKPTTLPKVETFTTGLCGRAPLASSHSDSKGNLGIFNGVESKPHSYPWMVSLTLYSNFRYKFFCSGMLINRKWVLTAAHCFQTIAGSEVTVVIGEDTTVSKNPLKQRGVQRSFIKNVYKHQLYDRKTSANDIALVELMTPVRYSVTVQPICLPSPDAENYADIYTLTGFGLMNDRKYPNRVMATHLPSVDLVKCATLLSTAKTFSTAVFESNLCAGFMEGGRDTCKGDSGGPMTRSALDKYGRKRTIAAGIVSWGDWCGKFKKPGVYTDVKKYLDWIDFMTKVPFSYPDGRYSKATKFVLRDFDIVKPSQA